MNPETQTPQPDNSMYVVPTTMSETLQSAMDDKQAFAAEVQEAERTRTLIEVTGDPGQEEHLEVRNTATPETRAALGGTAIEATNQSQDTDQEPGQQ